MTNRSSESEFTPAPTGDAAHEATLERAECGDAVAAVAGNPGAPGLEDVDRLIAAGDAALRRLALVEAENERLTGLLASSDEEYRLHEVIAAENERLRVKLSVSACESFSDGFRAGALWARQPVIVSDEREALAAALVDYAPFNPEWDMLEATRESLREHMAMVTALRQRVETLEAKLRAMVQQKLEPWEDRGVDGEQHCAFCDLSRASIEGPYGDHGEKCAWVAANAALTGDPAPPPCRPLRETLKAIERAIPPPSGQHHALTYCRYGSDDAGWKDKLGLHIRGPEVDRVTTFFVEEDELQQPIETLVADIRVDPAPPPQEKSRG